MREGWIISNNEIVTVAAFDDVDNSKPVNALESENLIMNRYPYDKGGEILKTEELLTGEHRYITVVVKDQKSVSGVIEAMDKATIGFEESLNGEIITPYESVLATYSETLLENQEAGAQKVVNLLICDVNADSTSLSHVCFEMAGNRISHELILSSSVPEGGHSYLRTVCEFAFAESKLDTKPEKEDMEQVMKVISNQSHRLSGNYDQYLFEIEEDGKDTIGNIGGEKLRNQSPLSYHHVYSAFSSLSSSITKALDDIKDLDKVDAVVITGDFGKIFMLQWLVSELTGLKKQQIIVDGTNSYCLKGAGLLAAGKVSFVRKSRNSIFIKKMGGKKILLTREGQELSSQVPTKGDGLFSGILPCSEMEFNFLIKRRGDSGFEEVSDFQVSINKQLIGYCNGDLIFNHLLQCAELILTNPTSGYRSFFRLKQLYA
ncbi:MAG: hypothetical protein Roseis2KO_41670 [Roseivirga sp.]